MPLDVEKAAAFSNPAKAAGAPAEEIKITPGMVKAGAEAVWEFRGFDPNFVAEKVFLAMMEHVR